MIQPAGTPQYYPTAEPRHRDARHATDQSSYCDPDYRHRVLSVDSMVIKTALAFRFAQRTSADERFCSSSWRMEPLMLERCQRQIPVQVYRLLSTCRVVPVLFRGKNIAGWQRLKR